VTERSWKGAGDNPAPFFLLIVLYPSLLWGRGHGEGIVEKPTYMGLRKDLGSCAVVFELRGVRYSYEMECRDAYAADWLAGKSVWKAMNYAKKRAWKMRKRDAARELLAVAREIAGAHDWSVSRHVVGRKPSRRFGVIYELSWVGAPYWTSEEDRKALADEMVDDYRELMRDHGWKAKLEPIRKLGWDRWQGVMSAGYEGDQEEAEAQLARLGFDLR